MRVAASEKRPQPQLDRIVQYFISNDRAVFAAWTDDRLPQKRPADAVLPKRKRAALEPRQKFKSSRMNDAGVTVARQLHSVDGLVELGDHHHALWPRSRRRNQQPVVAARIDERQARAGPAAEAVGVDPFE